MTNLPATIFAVRWLTVDTIRQTRASGLLAAFAAVSVVAVMVCMSITIYGDLPTLPVEPGENVNMLNRKDREVRELGVKETLQHGVDVIQGDMSVGFGAVTVPLTRPRNETVRFLQAVLAGGVADALGLLLVLVWTAGLVPAFVEPSAASVLLAKPMPRSLVLVGKFFGVLASVMLAAFLFVGATWMALGVRTQVWDGRYFLVLPVLLVHFAAIYAVSVLIGVWTRSATASALGAVTFWFACWAVNMGRHQVVSAGDQSIGSNILRGLYWLLPKPADFTALLVDVLGARQFFRPVDAVFGRHVAIGGEWVLITGLLFSAIMVSLACWRWSKIDY